MCSLYILDINPLLNVLLANTFFHSVGCSLGLVDGFLSCAKCFSFMQSHLFIFPFVSLAQGDTSTKASLRAMSEFTANVVFQDFYGLGLMFKSLVQTVI